MNDRYFVPYEIALIAAEKGFREECMKFYYYGELETDSIFRQYPEHCVNAPVYDQLRDWFLKYYKKNIIIAKSNHGWIYSLNGINVNNFSWNSYPTYHKALDKAFSKAFAEIKKMENFYHSGLMEYWGYHSKGMLEDLQTYPPDTLVIMDRENESGQGVTIAEFIKNTNWKS